MPGRKRIYWFPLGVRNDVAPAAFTDAEGHRHHTIGTSRTPPGTKPRLHVPHRSNKHPKCMSCVATSFGRVANSKWSLRGSPALPGHALGKGLPPVLRIHAQQTYLGIGSPRAPFSEVRILFPDSPWGRTASSCLKNSEGWFSNYKGRWALVGSKLASWRINLPKATNRLYESGLSSTKLKPHYG